MLGISIVTRKAFFFIKWLTTVVCVAGLTSSNACGSDTDRSIQQLYHTAWTAKDGAPTQTTGITRTRDGYLWIASHLGLFRFNGLRFELYQPPAGVTFPSNDILNVLGTRTGGLWVSFNPSGAVYIAGNQVQLFDQPGLELHSFVEDNDGRVWATTQGSLRYFDLTTWKEVHDPALEGKRLWNLFCDRSGALWVATDQGIALLPYHGKSFQMVMLHSNVRQIQQDKDGEMWMVDWYGLIRPIFSNSRGDHPRFRGFGTPHSAFFFDRDGSLWLKTSANGVGRIRAPWDSTALQGGRTDRMEWFTSNDGLTHDSVSDSLEDAEGNIWISTFQGLDRFRHSAFVPIRLGRRVKEFTIQAAEGGDIWVGSATPSPLLLLSGQGVAFKGPTTQVASVCRDSKGIIWWGAHGGIWKQEGTHFDFFPQPGDLPRDWIWEVVADDQTGGLWIGLGDSGLIFFKDGVWSKVPKPASLPPGTPDATFHENEKRIWFGYRGNQIAELSSGKVKLYTAADGVNLGRVRIIRGGKGLLWFGGETGLQVLREGRFTTVRTTGSEPIETVTGIVEASDGSLWLNELHGVLRIPPSDIDRISNDPNQPVTPRRFDELDGLPGATPIEFRSSTMVEASDRKLWVVTDGGVAWTDPSRERANTFEPSVLITGMHTSARDDSYSNGASLPAGTTSIRFNYEALSLSIPERVQFKYILIGANDEWHGPDSRRDATYNNLAPGQYQFTVAASNGDGKWTPANARLQFSILPLFYQTLWFRVLAIFLLGMLVWMLFLVRLRQSNERIEAQLGERLMERDRIARELHDTLLQGFQMLVLRFQVIADTISADNPTRRLLEDSLSRAESTLEEGRDKVSALRSDGTLRKDLAVELAEFGRELAVASRTTFQITVEGNPISMQPIISEEIQMIAREAIANSFRHAAASSIECVIQFAPQHFIFVCKDNGCGIPENVLETKNKGGHWGLVNMAERARKIGAVLHVARDGTGGTEVRLKLRAGVAYARNPRSRLVRLLKFGRE